MEALLELEKIFFFNGLQLFQVRCSKCVQVKEKYIEW